MQSHDRKRDARHHEPKTEGRDSERPRGRRRVNPLVAAGITEVTFKDLNVLKYFVTERGRLMPRRVSGLTAKQQRMVARAVKQARLLGMLPYLRFD